MKNNKTVYRHYGNSTFVPYMFNNIKNAGAYINKPFGGLWASSVNSYG